ncbi:hypothetical protein RB595_000237 [Gaeumannomyces hyphopodioides]
MTKMAVHPSGGGRDSPSDSDDDWPSKREREGRHRRVIEVRFGYSTISAIAEAPWPPWDHVLRVKIRRGLCFQWLASVLPRLPQPVQRVARAWFPGWFLPTRIVLKKLKSGWDEEFDNEVANYRRLKELQGRVVPIFYGEGKCEGTRCLLLSEVDGVRADQQKKPPIALNEYKRRVEAALRELHRFDVSPTDEKLANTILTPDGGLVFVDLEYAGDREPPDWEPPDLEADAAGWAYWYREWLQNSPCFRYRVSSREHDIYVA